METPSFSDILYKPDMQTFKQVLDTEIKVPKINVKNPLFALYTHGALMLRKKVCRSAVTS